MQMLVTLLTFYLLNFLFVLVSSNTYHVEQEGTVLLECPLIPCPKGYNECCPVSSSNTSFDLEATYVLWKFKDEDNSKLFGHMKSGLFEKMANQYKLFQNGTINITNTTCAFSGEYECRVSFRNGFRGRMGSLRLDVHLKDKHEGYGEETVCSNNGEPPTTVNPEEPSLEPVYILLISISTGAILLCCLLIILLPKAKAKWNKWCRRERYVDDILKEVPLYIYKSHLEDHKNIGFVLMSNPNLHRPLPTLPSAEISTT